MGPHVQSPSSRCVATHSFLGFTWIYTIYQKRYGLFGCPKFGTSILSMVQKSCVHQLRLVVSPIIYYGFFIRHRWLFGMGILNHQQQLFWSDPTDRFRRLWPSLEFGTLRWVFVQFNCVESLWRLVYFCDFSMVGRNGATKKGMNQGQWDCFFFRLGNDGGCFFFSTFISNRKVQHVYSIQYTSGT